jgi:hypothetical protein
MGKLGLDCKLATPFNSVEKLENGMMQVNLANGEAL